MFLCLRTKTRPVRFFGLLALGSRQRPQAAFLDSRRCDLRFLPRSICFGGILCFQLYFLREYHAKLQMQMGFPGLSREPHWNLFYLAACEQDVAHVAI